MLNKKDVFTIKLPVHSSAYFGVSRAEFRDLYLRSVKTYLRLTCLVERGKQFTLAMGNYVGLRIPLLRISKAFHYVSDILLAVNLMFYVFGILTRKYMLLFQGTSVLPRNCYIETANVDYPCYIWHSDPENRISIPFLKTMLKPAS